MSFTLSPNSITTDGLCGPRYNNTICYPNMCCSSINHCGGSIGTLSGWCSVDNGNKGGADNGSGLYDGVQFNTIFNSNFEC